MDDLNITSERRREIDAKIKAGDDLMIFTEEDLATIHEMNILILKTREREDKEEYFKQILEKLRSLDIDKWKERD